MAIELKAVLIDIAVKTYGELSAPFTLEMIAEERKTFHGQYWPKKHLIQIYNLSRPSEYIISTTIHELAHHIDYVQNGSTAHNQRFYTIMKALLETAVKAGYIKYEVIKKASDVRDITQMEKLCGTITATYDEEMDDNKNHIIIKVFQSYDIKDTLRERGYKFDGTEKAWQKKILIQDADEEKEYVESLSNNVKIDLMKLSEIKISAPYYIVVTIDTFTHKDFLKANGFFFNKSGNPANAWIKKIPAQNLDEETKMLKKKGIMYKLKSKIKINK